MSHAFHPSVLREYDIRGIVGKTLSVADAYATGRAFGSMLVATGGTVACLGYDGRVSSVALSQAMSKGLQECGLKVINVGLGPTPMLYYAVKLLKAAGGVMITGSHNPAEYNGFKMTTYSGPVFGDKILEIGKMAASEAYVHGVGSEESYDIRDEYVNRLLIDYDGIKDLKVVWDCGNGAAGDVVSRLAQKLPGTHIVIFGEIDGTFPNHHPDPTVAENLVDLQAAVKLHGADIGIGLDGDGDRIGAIDQHGEIIWGDQLLALYAGDVLKTHPGATIIADVKSSQTLFDEIARLGGKPMMWKTGHSLIKAKMAEENAPLAGEMSGHIFFADKFYGYDDAPYCGVRLIALVSRSGKSLGDLRLALPQVVNTPETRFQVDESRKFAVVEEVRARLAAQTGLEVSSLDGVRVKTPEGWWLLRASNTQDVLVVRAEAQSVAGLNILKDIIRLELGQSGISAPAGF